MGQWKLPVQAAIAALMMGCATFVAFAIDGKPPQHYPELVGQWVVIKKDAVYWHRDIQSQENGPSHLRIDEQTGPVLEGVFFWQVSPGSGRDHDGLSEVSKSKEPVIGMIGWDGASITLVEHPDTGTMQGRMINSDTMELVHYEAGPYATISRYLLVRP
ncbi:hypothetical protein PsAD5_05120 [Pseudovibrio sp. Ad5]|uniref:hypothetical protein n=1 Tax=Pseudovibrio sp. Ad5 TaxID=989436 RepID=UPI0007AEB5D1|nr:hypothetical protein [Pseudovibrio sp. Ad5]KZK88770.1 hypothetical protein PsAD5_05120 [Pseudovibrio sp. Ad5]